jgi:hypothetical protein
MQLTSSSKSHQFKRITDYPLSILTKWKNQEKVLRNPEPSLLERFLDNMPQIKYTFYPNIFEDENKKLWATPYVNLHDPNSQLTFNYLSGLQASWLLPIDISKLEKDIISIAQDYLDISYFIVRDDRSIFFIVGSIFLHKSYSFTDMRTHMNTLDKVFSLIIMHCQAKISDASFKALDMFPIIDITFEAIEFSSQTKKFLNLDIPKQSIVSKNFQNLSHFQQNFSMNQSMSLGLQVRLAFQADHFLKKLFKFKDGVAYCSNPSSLEINLNNVVEVDFEKRRPVCTLDLYSVSKFFDIYYNLQVDIPELSTLLHDIAAFFSPIVPLPIQPYRELDYLLALYLSASFQVGCQGPSPIFVYNDFKKWLHEDMKFSLSKNDNFISPVITKFQYQTLQGTVSIDQKKDRNGGRNILLDGKKQTQNPMFM